MVLRSTIALPCAFLCLAAVACKKEPSPSPEEVKAAARERIRADEAKDASVIAAWESMYHTDLWLSMRKLDVADWGGCSQAELEKRSLAKQLDWRNDYEVMLTNWMDWAWASGTFIEGGLATLSFCPKRPLTRKSAIRAVRECLRIQLPAKSAAGQDRVSPMEYHPSGRNIHRVSFARGDDWGTVSVIEIRFNWKISATDLIRLSEARFRNKRPEAARESLNQILKEHPKSYEALIVSDLIAALRGKIDDPFQGRVSLCTAEDAYSIEETYISIKGLAEIYPSLSPSKRNAVDLFFGPTTFPNPDLSLSGLLRTAQTFEGSLQAALQESRSLY